jgi:hypothetical protein
VRAALAAQRAAWDRKMTRLREALAADKASRQLAALQTQDPMAARQEL